MKKCKTIVTPASAPSPPAPAPSPPASPPPSPPPRPKFVHLFEDEPGHIDWREHAECPSQDIDENDPDWGYAVAMAKKE